jgi:hypothetical protein
LNSSISLDLLNALAGEMESIDAYVARDLGIIGKEQFTG